MAGGKETPRQKMIGMMYLVLTALLALNVSKSILDAFVAIEENTQKANIVQYLRGKGFYDDVKSELASTKNDAENKAKREKLMYVLKRMEEIDAASAKLIVDIDKIKIDILKASGESVDAYKDKDENTIMWRKYDKDNASNLPIRMNLMAVQAKDQYDVPMHHIIGEDIKNPNGEGKKLWADFNKYRSEIVELVGTYKWGDKEFKFKPKDINTYESNEELGKLVIKMIDDAKGTINKEDRQALTDLYIQLTKLEKNKVHDIKDVHWIGMTFDHSPLVAAIASLSSMQQDVLSARALAMAHWKSKVSTGEYSFNKIMPLAYGPSVSNSGDDVEFKVLMAAFDSDNQPTVTCEQGGEITYPGDGVGYIKLKAGAGPEWTVRGTVTIRNKAGVKKTDNWEQKVIIMKPQGSIELPELNVLYRGYDNKVDPTASGYDQTILNGSNATITKSGNLYVVKPGTGREAVLTVSGKSTATGKTVELKKVTYRVSNLPDPELYWGAAKSGTKGSKAETKLFAKYPPEIPLNASFTIVDWECQVPGAQGRPPSGTGSDISPASGLLRAAKPDMQVSFICTVVGPDGVRRKKAGSFKL